MRNQFSRAFVFLLFLSCAASAGAQQGGVTATVTAAAPLFLQPGAQTPLRVAKAGTLLKVLQEDGEWLEVEFNDPQFGRRVGWVTERLRDEQLERRCKRRLARYRIHDSLAPSA